MRKAVYRPYVLLIGLLFFSMSIPQDYSDSFRSVVVCSLSPSWHGLHLFKEKIASLVTIPMPGTRNHSAVSEEMVERLNQENLLLRSQIENVREWLLLEDRIQEQVDRVKAIAPNHFTDARWKEFFIRRSRDLCAGLELQAQSLPAKVVFREPASWSSSLWLNVGEKNNSVLGKKIVAKNSPVLVGTSIVGIVEYVGERQSRVRLVTDSRLTPSVRAIRGSEQNRYLLEHLEALLFALEVRDDLTSSQEDLKGALTQLHRLKNRLKQQTGESYLAKGELFGSSSPLWRSRSQVLRGIGFNYDFADAEGSARDLRTGEPYDITRKREPTSILKAGDLLVTTGFDGVFPAGLRVATISKVQGLKEGASTYEIEAISTAGNLDELQHVFVLPPVRQP